ncbi:MAG: acyltransferase [Xanthomonadales bacterium]|nr:acyltransferase [Xanthomonadales bacterium]
MIRLLEDRLRTPTDILFGRLRAQWWRLRGATIGAKTRLGQRTTCNRPSLLQVGERCEIEQDVYLKISEETARLCIGDRVFIGAGCKINSILLFSIGEGTLIAPGCFIVDHNHGIAADRPISQQPCNPAPVVIAANTWLGAHVVVLPGVTIGEVAVVAAGSVVTNDVAPMTIVAGVPARHVRHR